MTMFRGGLLAAAVCVALGGCHFPWQDDKTAPTGQVVAKVGDREITLRELQAEMAGARPADPKAEKAAEQAALNEIVGRTLLAQAAKEQGIDKTPDFDIAKQRVLDSLIVQRLQAKIAADVPQPSKSEAQDFVNSHPDIFAERKVFVVDQIRMNRPSDPTVIKALEPLKTLDQIEALLKTDKIPYQRSDGNFDAVGADPRLVDEILKRAPGEVFVVPGPNGLLVNAVRETKVIPFTGPPAEDYALQFLTRQRTQETVQKSMQELMSARADKVVFGKAYAPPKPPAPATSPTPAGPTTNP